jgi:hypothetical protein
LAGRWQRETLTEGAFVLTQLLIRLLSSTLPVSGRIE